MGLEFAEFTERLIPISEFSQGKAGRIFNDVSENKRDYIVLKNNQPTAVLMPVEEYREVQHKLAKFEELLDFVENQQLLQMVSERTAKYKASNTDEGSSFFEDFMKEEGYSMEELEKLSAEVEIE